MSEKKLNNWEQKIDKNKLKEKKDYDLQAIYKQAHSELSLQQSKRDQIITIYLALCSFLLPFALGEELISTPIKGAIFVIVGLIGALFSYITIRYREYKEAYWLCCQTLTVLMSIETNELDKATVQQAFAHCLRKKGKGYLRHENGEVHFDRRLYMKKNLFSSETFHFIIIALMSSFIAALGIFLLLNPFGLAISIPAAIVLGIAALMHLIFKFFRFCINIYLPLEELNSPDDEKRRDDAFNKVFSKAWFLHFYCDI